MFAIKEFKYKQKIAKNMLIGVKALILKRA